MHTEIMLKLYLSLVRPKLEYCIQAWRPYLKDIDLLEKVQKRATRMMITEKGLSYEERLKKLGIITGDEKTAWRLNRGFQNFQGF